MTTRSMTDRMLGALRLQTAAYEEIEADEKATEIGRASCRERVLRLV